MPKRKKKKKEEKGGNFTMLFLSLTIILLAFFIMLNSIAELQVDRIQKALKSISGLSAGVGVFGQGFGVDEESISAGTNPAARVIAKLIHDAVRQSMAKWGEGEDLIKTFEDERKLVISIQETGLFSAGTETIHPRIFSLLDGIGEIIKRVGIPMTVQGHTDASGTGNWELSATRAIQVQRYLMEGVKVPMRLVEAEGFAEFQPVADNATREGKARNRRVDLVFYRRDLNRFEIQ